MKNSTKKTITSVAKYTVLTFTKVLLDRTVCTSVYKNLKDQDKGEFVSISGAVIATIGTEYILNRTINQIVDEDADEIAKFLTEEAEKENRSKFEGCSKEDMVKETTGSEADEFMNTVKEDLDHLAQEMDLAAADEDDEDDND